MSLNQEEKELLVIYIDGSPSSDQIDQAQNLLKESEEARKFENVLRGIILRNPENVSMKRSSQNQKTLVNDSNIFSGNDSDFP